VQITLSVHPDADLPNAGLVARLPERGLAVEQLPTPDMRADEGDERLLRWDRGQLERGAAQELVFSFVVAEDAPDLMALPFSLESEDVGSATVTAIIKRPMPDAEVRVTPEDGGVLASADGRV
jgi:hypothetical protein